MSFRIKGWPDGHPHLTKIDGYPFGYPQPTNPNPLLSNKRDGYAASFRRLYKRYQNRAKEKKMQFTLSEQDFYELTSQPCFFCATPPSKKVSGKFANPYVYNGIDRMDFAKGYTFGNVVACCWEHNDLKGRSTFTELYRQSLAFVLSVSSRTALDIGDAECLELLSKLFPNVRFLKEQHAIILEDIRKEPHKHRWNWLLQPVKTQTK